MFVSAAVLCAQDMAKVRSLNRSGNDKYEKGQYQDAEMDYRRALSIDPYDSLTCFNLATALIRQQDEAKMAEADSLLTLVIRDADRDGNFQTSARALYQKGEIAMMAQQFQQAADLYKASLKRNPTDNEARFNYILAKKQIQDQDNEDQQQDQQQQQQQQDQQDQQQEEKEQQQDQQDQQQDQQQQQQQEQQQMSDDQRQSILEQNERDEKETQQRVMQKQQQRDKDKEREMEIRRMNGTLKDW